MPSTPLELVLAIETLPDAVVGLALEVVPADAPVEWQLRFDDALVPESEVSAGSLGLSLPALARGLSGEARAFASGATLPAIDPRRDRGVFVVREPGADGGASDATESEAAREMKDLLEAWGYAKTGKTRLPDS